MRIHYEQKDGRHSQDIDCLSSLCLSQGKPQLCISQSFCLLNIYTQAAMHAQGKSHTFRRMGIWQIHGPQNSLENGPQNSLENSHYVSSQFYIQFLTLASLLNWWPHRPYHNLPLRRRATFSLQAEIETTWLFPNLADTYITYKCISICSVLPYPLLLRWQRS